jgi:hypothetical protein
MTKIKISRKIRNKIQAVAAATMLLFAFGAVAHANVKVIPSSVSFGSETVGSTSASQTVTITNGNRRHVTISSVSDSVAEFSFSGPSLPVVLNPGQSLTGSVTFKPLAAQAYSGVLSFKQSNGFTDSVSLSGVGTSVTVTPQAPSITSQPVSQSVSAGQTATFRVAATGTAPMTYEWMKNGAAVSGATSSSYTTPPTMASDNASKFTVMAKNSAGSATSVAASLTVNSASQSCVTSTEAWANDPLSQTATGSFRVTFDATPSAAMIDGVTGLSFGPASAYTNLAAIVRFNNTGTIDAMNSTAYTSIAKIPYLAGIPYHFILDVNAVAHTYSAYVMIGSVQTTIGSNLVFRAAQATTSSFNNIGAMSTIASHSVCNVALSQSTAVAVAPSITTQPASQSVIAGKAASFKVAATGTAPLTYQWSKSGVAISEATSASYTTPAETTTDNNATFTVKISNNAGNMASTPATLTVSASSLLLNSSASSLSFGSVNVSGSSSQTVTLTNAGNASVTISNVSVSGAGFNATGASGVILAPGQTTGVTATFAPSAAGSMAGKVSVASNATNSPDSIALSGTGVSAVSHSVALSWSPSTSTVTGYNTYASTQSGGPYTKLTSAPVTATSYTDGTVQAGQTYYFVVTSVDSSNVESAYSAEVSALVP